MTRHSPDLCDFWNSKKVKVPADTTLEIPRIDFFLFSSSGDILMINQVKEREAKMPAIHMRAA